CGIPGARNAWIDAQIKIQRTDSVIVFETLPENAVPELYYENEQSFDVSSIEVGSFHQGNVQNQSASLPAIVNLSFANCVSFGNGVESMSIEDSITGDYLKLGHRVHSISTGYKLTNRFSDMTYSGVYNRESNVNNLNEFNLGLLNFKTLEPFYGSIQYMYPRESDILVFQEDKVSKVLLGKNILSDAVGGSTLASIPEVLGNQVPRPEEYGIDKYPETFAVYGDKIYFTDAKRGAVIQMMGDSMTRISDIGMISYFRNALINNNGLKRGGYDPYMRDYVFHFGEPVAEIQNIEFLSSTTNYNTSFGDIESSLTAVPKFEIIVTIKRLSSWLILFKLITGIIVAFLISSCVFWIKPINTDPRFGLCVGGLFAAIGNKYIVESIVPSTNELT
ncbi:hypothetical protein EBT25_17420, partial [bacterium]|nr:hypothetical protein [bacterium]